jgi:hypothetical protein
MQIRLTALKWASLSQRSRRVLREKQAQRAALAAAMWNLREPLSHNAAGHLHRTRLVSPCSLSQISPTNDNTMKLQLLLLLVCALVVVGSATAKSSMEEEPATSLEVDGLEEAGGTAGLEDAVAAEESHEGWFGRRWWLWSREWARSCGYG